MTGFGSRNGGRFHRTRGTRLVLVVAACVFVCGFVTLHPDRHESVARTGAGQASAAAMIDRTPVPEPALGPASETPSLRPTSFDTATGTLVWRAVHGQVDGGRFRAADAAPGSAVAASVAAPAVAPAAAPAAAPAVAHVHGLDGIGFPAIVSSPGAGMRVYRPLITWQTSATGRYPIADVRCMGLKPASVAVRAARYEALILELSMKHDISANLVKAVITQESCFNPAAVSRAGAIGLMQLMPQTAAWLKITDPHDPDANLRAGIRYLASLERRYGDTVLALAAYNAGPGNVARYGGVPPFEETRAYVASVTAHYRRYRAATALAAR